MNKHEMRELFEVLIVETKRQRRIELMEADRELARKYSEKNGEMYCLIVDYVETWIRTDSEKEGEEREGIPLGEPGSHIICEVGEYSEGE